jgi:hypothetical protein
MGLFEKNENFCNFAEKNFYLSLTESLKMMRSLTFVGMGVGMMLALYYSHTALAYIYYNYCTQMYMGSPHCKVALNVMVSSVDLVYNVWAYIGTLLSTVVLYVFSRMFGQMNDIKKQFEMSQDRLAMMQAMMHASTDVKA